MEKGLLAYLLIPMLAAAGLAAYGSGRGRLPGLLAAATLLAGLATLLRPLLAPAMVSRGFADVPGDGLPLLMTAAVYLSGACVAFFSAWYDDDGAPGKPGYYPLLLLSVAAMTGAVCATDLFTLYVFTEALAVASSALTASSGAPRGTEAALKQFFLTLPGSAFIVAGLAVLLLTVGGLSFEGLRLYMASDAPAAPAAFGAALMLLGYAMKAGLAPFHAWLPDACQGAGAPVPALLAGAAVKVSGVYALLRLSTLMRFFDGRAQALSELTMLLGLLSMAVGALAALRQKDLKRLLAFAGIGQAGYIALAAGLGTPLAVMGAVAQLFSHAAYKTSLFLNAAAIERAAGTTDMAKLGGLKRYMPWTAGTCAVAMLSEAGVPPLAGFWSKLLILLALWESGLKAYAALALLFSVVTLAAFAAAQRRVFFGPAAEASAASSEAGAPLLAPVLLLSAVTVALGLLFPYFYAYVSLVAERVIL